MNPTVTPTSVIIPDYLNQKPLLQSLEASIKKHGILKPVLCINTGGKLIVCSGSGRLKIAKKLNMSKIPVTIISTFNFFDLRMKLITLASEERLTVSDKLISLYLCRDYSNLDDNKSFFTEELKLPDSVVALFLNSINVETNNFLMYAIRKNISVKIIKDYLNQISTVRSLITQIASKFNPKQNSMRSYIQFLSDIAHIDSRLITEIMSDMPFEGETELTERVMELRYPEFTKKEREASELKKRVLEFGADLEFPPYFEGGYGFIKFKINAGTGSKKVNDKMRNFPDRVISDIVDLLR
ncbi:MAG: ParB N-terminal domain-containing protein [Spirochaetes bacterium]|jgi:hypothetical protein|nr:ParB N-terminal domain-containing protein [Spirochaetota bacterium]